MGARSSSATVASCGDRPRKPCRSSRSACARTRSRSARHPEATDSESRSDPSPLHKAFRSHRARLPIRCPGLGPSSLSTRILEPSRLHAADLSLGEPEPVAGGEPARRPRRPEALGRRETAPSSRSSPWRLLEAGNGSGAQIRRQIALPWERLWDARNGPDRGHNWRGTVGSDENRSDAKPQVSGVFGFVVLVAGVPQSVLKTVVDSLFVVGSTPPPVGERERTRPLQHFNATRSANASVLIENRDDLVVSRSVGGANARYVIHPEPSTRRAGQGQGDGRSVWGRRPSCA